MASRLQKKPKHPWRAFEEAVARFAAAMDPQALVAHDVRLPDRETSRPRQRDVWIEAKICDHYPVRVLVSCKRYQRKLHQTDIDHFHGELLSSHAQKGVLYSYSGFAQSALLKADQLGICCCRLFHNEPPDIPISLALTKQYCCAAQIQLSFSPACERSWGIATWGDLLQLPMGDGRSVLDAIASVFAEEEKKALAGAAGNFPTNFSGEITLASQDKHPLLRFTVWGWWKIYASRLDFVLLDGSYSYTANDFKGTVTGPSVDRLSTHPGPGWTLLTERPTTMDAPLIVLGGADTRSALLDKLGQEPLCVG